MFKATREDREEITIKPINDFIACKEQVYYKNGIKSGTRRTIVPNPASAAKGYVLAAIKNGVVAEVPYSTDMDFWPCRIIEDTPYSLWYTALTSFNGWKDGFADEVKKINFWKYDDDLANKLIAEYRLGSTSKKQDVQIDGTDELDTE
jgi:hypothetical protein